MTQRIKGQMQSGDIKFSVPKTWADFEASNDKIKAAGIVPVIATYGTDSAWTSQLFVLADYCNTVDNLLRNVTGELKVVTHIIPGYVP